MASIEVHAGDFCLGHTTVVFGKLILRNAVTHAAEPTPFEEISRLERAADRHLRRRGAFKWDLVGASLHEGIDLIPGAPVGEAPETVTFSALFRDGRRLLATTDVSTFETMRAAVVDAAIRKRTRKPR